MRIPKGVGSRVVWPPILTMMPFSPTGTWTIAPFMRGPTYVGTEMLVSFGRERSAVSSSSMPSRTARCQASILCRRLGRGSRASKQTYTESQLKLYTQRSQDQISSARIPQRCNSYSTSARRKRQQHQACPQSRHYSTPESRSPWTIARRRRQTPRWPAREYSGRQ